MFLVLIGVFLIFLFLQKYTRFGYHVRALGNGTQIAMNIGVNLTRTRYLAFLVEGLFLGLAAVMDMSITGSEIAVTSMLSCSTAFSLSWRLWWACIWQNTAACCWEPLSEPFL